MKPTITAFKNNPDRGKGLGRDMRVRWALEELGLAYDVRLETFEELKQATHLARNPFGQIPTLEDGELVLFESGAIVLHLAEQHPGLLPADPNGRMHAIMWMFASLSTIEPPILDLSMAVVAESKESWFADRMPLLKQRLRNRLTPLAARLGDAEWLDGEFSAGDLMMIAVLLRLRPSGILVEFPNIDAYVSRGEARPAYQRAFAAQLAVWEASQASGA
ncbi:MAG TPA: glutathione S-transferase family protein [Kofleriaceae bacterium]